METTPASPADVLFFASKRGRWAIAATVLGSGMVMLDGTVVGLALPAIGRELDAGLPTLQWIVNAYTLSLAALLLLGGKLGDRFGRKRMFVAGTIAFAAASLLCGVAWSAPVLVAARAIQGAAGALLTPGSLAILQASFAENDRSKAIGAWTGLSGIAAAIGPFIGGALITSLSWRLVFFLNLPVAIALVPISLRYIPESRDPSAGPIDLPGVLLAAVGLAGVTYGLTEGPQLGWSSPIILSSLIGGAAALLAFIVVEFFIEHPLVPLQIFRSMQFSGANAVTFLVYAALSGALFLLPIALQQVAGYSAFQAGLALLPVTLVLLVLSTPSGALAARIGPRLQMSIGPVVVAAGMALFSRLDAEGNYLAQVLPAMLVFGLGLAITVAPLTAAVLAAAPPENVGIASAVNNDVSFAAGLVAVAVLPAAAGISAASFEDTRELARGFHAAMWIAAGASALGGSIAALTIRKTGKSSRTQPSSPEHRGEK